MTIGWGVTNYCIIYSSSTEDSHLIEEWLEGTDVPVSQVYTIVHTQHGMHTHGSSLAIISSLNKSESVLNSEISVIVR